MRKEQIIANGKIKMIDYCIANQHDKSINKDDIEYLVDYYIFLRNENKSHDEACRLSINCLFSQVDISFNPEVKIAEIKKILLDKLRGGFYGIKNCKRITDK